MMTNDGAKSDDIRTDGTGKGNDVTMNDTISKDDWLGSYMNKEALLRIEKLLRRIIILLFAYIDTQHGGKNS